MADRAAVGWRGVAIRRLGSQQVADEEILHPPEAVGAPHAVIGIGHDHQLEVLPGANEGVGQSKCGFRRHVGVHLADDQHQLAAQPVGVVDVRGLGVPGTDGIAHPLLVPRGLVHPVVMAAARRNRDLVKVGMKKHAPGCVLATRRDPVDAHPAQVVIGILRRGRLVPEDSIGEPGVLEVVPADVVKGLGAICRSHAVDLHDDEAEVRQRSVLVERAERLGNERALRARVD